MKLSTLALATAAGLAAASAQAQVNLYLVNIQNLSSLSDGAGIEVGTLPTGVALIQETKTFTYTEGDKDQRIESLFVGGLANVGFGTVQIVKVEDVLNNAQQGRSFRSIPTSATQISAAQRGVTGMDYQPGVGLVATFDQGGFGWELGGQAIIWDVNTQLNPILRKVSPAFQDLNGKAGPAWDAGPDGAGWTFTGGTGPAPIPAFLDFSSDVRGPFGLNPTTLDGAAGAEVYGPGSTVVGPIINGNDPFGFAVGGTIWRDLDISPDGNLIVARADNDLVIANRSGGPGATVTKVIRSSTTNNDAPFVIGQNVEILHGVPSGDLIVYNNRPSSSSLSLGFGSLNFVDTSGNPVTVNFLNPDGSPATQADGATPLPTSGTGFYSFFWDRGLLVVLDGSVATGDNPGRTAYIFQTCLGDLNHDGATDFGDFLEFFNAFDVGDAGYGDVNRDGASDFGDFLAFFNAFDASC